MVYTTENLRPLAEAAGYDGSPYRWDEERRVHLRCEPDAAFFHLYGLTEEDTAYILGTFPIIMRQDEKTHDDYRTKRVILERYAELSRGRCLGPQRCGYGLIEFQSSSDLTRSAWKCESI